jgi:hypothetical protein
MVVYSTGKTKLTNINKGAILAPYKTKQDGTKHNSTFNRFTN